MFHPLHRGACGIVWHAMTRTVIFAPRVSTLDETQVFFKTYKQFQQSSSKHRIDLMKLLHMTVKLSNVNNNVLSWFPSHEKDIYKIFMGGKQSIQTNLPVPTTFNIAKTTCMSLDVYIDNVLGHGIPIIFAHDSTTGPNFAGLHGSEQWWMVVDRILANAPDPKNFVMVGYIWSDGFLGSNIRQKDNSV